VHRVHGHKRLDDDASLLSQESDGVVFWMRRPGRRPVATQKKLILGQPTYILQWPLSKKVVTTVRPFTVTPNMSSLTVINPVLAKYLKHPHLTRQCSNVGQVRWKMYA